MRTVMAKGGGVAQASKGNRETTSLSTRLPKSNTLAVAGSSLLWAWGFVCYLSPTLFPDGSKTESVGLEVGFFVSQACIVAMACLLVALSPLRRIAVHRFMPMACAFASSVCTLFLAGFVASGHMAGIIVCGIVHGICIPLLGAAWGARYSIGSKGMQSLIVLSFLVAYALYFAVPLLPYGAGIVFVGAMPVLSWGLWRIDARGRDVFCGEEETGILGAGVLETETLKAEASQKAKRFVFLDELFDGSWKLSGMPWNALVAVLIAAFVGNLVASAAMGFSYENADGLFRGGAFVCACIATMALVPLTSGGQSLGVETVYRITLTFTAVGLVGMLVSNGVFVSLFGALVQGCAFFFQVLIIVLVSRATWEKALSPLLSFCLAQAVIAVVVVVGNVAGKQISVWESCWPGAFEWMCAAAMLTLFLVLVKQAADADFVAKEDGIAIDAHLVDEQTPMPDVACMASEGRKDGLASGSAGASSKASRKETMRLCSDGGAALSRDEVKAALFAESFGLTRREGEVFSYLSKGRSLPYIADELFVTTGTVKTHTTHIYRKLGVNSRQELLDLFEEWKM